MLFTSDVFLSVSQPPNCVNRLSKILLTDFTARHIIARSLNQGKVRNFT